MKRYRVLSFDFDARVIRSVFNSRRMGCPRQGTASQNKQAIEQSLIDGYGNQASEAKRQNFIDLGDKPLSILAFHNRFLEQMQSAFVMGAYYQR